MRLAVLVQPVHTAMGIPDICKPVLDELIAETREFVLLG
jgi:IclR family acetate operon transcriptional repressor